MARKKQKRKIDPGIYKITIKGDTLDYQYWGQTAHLVDRKNEHFYDLRHKLHYNQFMQNVYNKYQNFEFERLEELAIDQLDEREQVYLDLHYGKDYCMNLLPYARSTRDYPKSKESVWKAINTKRDRYNSWSSRDSKPICLIINGVEYVFGAAKDAAEFLGVKKHNISYWMKSPTNWPNQSKSCKQIKNQTVFDVESAFFLD